MFAELISCGDHAHWYGTESGEVEVTIHESDNKHDSLLCNVRVS